MKNTIILTTATLVAFASPSLAAGPGKHKSNTHGHHGSVSKFERVVIYKSHKRLFRIKRRARADGYVSRFERRKIRQAQRRHNRLVARARRS